MLITTCVHDSMLEQAMEVHEKMQSANRNPNVVTYYSLITACARHGRIEWALLTYDGAARAGRKLDDVTYSTSIRVCANSGRKQETAKLAPACEV